MLTKLARMARFAPRLRKSQAAEKVAAHDRVNMLRGRASMTAPGLGCTEMGTNGHRAEMDPSVQSRLVARWRAP